MKRRVWTPRATCRHLERRGRCCVEKMDRWIEGGFPELISWTHKAWRPRQVPNELGVGRVPESPRVRVLSSRVSCEPVSIPSADTFNTIQRTLADSCLNVPADDSAHRCTAFTPCGLLFNAEYTTIGADDCCRYCPAHRRTDSASTTTRPAAGWLRDKVSTLALEALFSRRTLCNLSPPSGPEALDRDPRHTPRFPAKVWISVTALVSGQSSCPKRRSSPATEWVEGAHGYMDHGGCALFVSHHPERPEGWGEGGG